ncbi:cell division protein FtsQ/DivIB [Marinospirillum perlucidum]|uniref:cell division protein FtsQ/DivIB n=1 Tax=Marinospirillum perlucidum TaxID=1982602 RepID=UPI0013903A08|nr:cell division protein FtsQ/DivIB [Marinospirillum perlucidum]
MGQVAIYGEVAHLDQEDIRQRALPWLAEPFWKVDLEGLRRALEEAPWLKEVRISRNWPDRIKMELVERKPWAFWNEGALIDEQGEVFYPHNRDDLNLNVQLVSATDQLQEVLSLYELMSPELNTLGVKVSLIDLKPRGAWQIELDTGVTLLLGRDNIERRLNRFFWIWKNWTEQKRQEVDTIDMRYPNGLAVEWRQSRG